MKPTDFVFYINRFFFLVGIVALFAILFILPRRESLESNFKARIILFLYVVLAVILIIIFCLSFLALSIHLVFSIIYLFCWIIGLGQVITNYLALTGTLIVFSFIPKKLQNQYKLFPTDFYNDKNVITNILFGFFEVINIKTIIYLISFILVFIAGIETLSNKMIFHDVLMWINIKQIVLESVVSFIAFDRFYKAIVEDFNKNKPKIISLYNILADYFKKN
ncbi:hypothetical protein HP548_30955 [Paenibacillus taichungensis]|uniref:Uncharacterized protein n=1 Tax=Paenibacillus taichungensis TaxID=484184 RepID=A0ABX2MWR4_9BACL|nr:hypothetical protein [Paenibacillus taichungensis]NUU58506.1 hypothetical protein [Paenibacillus taichungensis]